MRGPTGVVGLLTLTALLLCATAGRAQRLRTSDDVVFMVGEATEALIDDYLAGNWVEADAQVDSIVSKENGVLEAMNAAGALPGTRDLFSYLVYRLRDYTFNRAEPVQAALVANQITAQLIDLDHGKATAAQLATARMDYLGREVLLLSQVDDDRGMLARRIDELVSTWNGVTSVILESGEAELVERVDDRLERLRQQPDRTTIAEVANEILDLVDELEAVVR
jgi:hypothetical protein